MSQQSTKAAKSIFIIILFGIGSKLLGFIREMLIAAKFGSGTETDTYFVAITAISLFTYMFSLSLNTTIVPIMSDIEKIEGKDGKKKRINNILNVVLFISILIVIFGIVCSPLIIKLAAHGFSGEQFNLAVRLMRIGMPVIIFSGILGVYKGYLESESMFTETASTQFPFNFTFIFYLLFLSAFFGIKGLMVTNVIAVISQILIQILGIRKTGYKYKFILDFSDPYIKKILHMVLPVLISVGVSDISKIIDKSLASTLVDGSISALNYSDRLNSLILVIFISAITTVLFPILSKEATKEKLDDFKRLVKNGINIIMIITIPATVGIIILSKPIVSLAFERGAFDNNATQMTAQALIFYSLGLVGMALRSFLEISYYSIQDTRTPMLNGILSVMIDVVFNLILIGPMGHRGLALSTSIGATVATGLLLRNLIKKIGNFDVISIIKSGFKSLFSSAIMGLVVYFAYYTLLGLSSGNTLVELGIMILSIGLGITIYFAILYLLKVDEIGWFMAMIKKKVAS